jgi:uncharacterized protein (TIGR02271 family)
MQHTLIAVFDNRNDAQSAMTEMLGAGFSQNEIRLSDDNAGVSDMTESTTTSGAAGEGIGAHITNFFKGIFGEDTPTVQQKYSTAIQHGHFVLTVAAQSEEEVERAADIVERFGPVDIDEKAAGWAGASDMPQSGMPRTDAMNNLSGAQAGASLQSQTGAGLSQSNPGMQSGMAQGGAALAGGAQLGSVQGGSVQDAGISGSQQRNTESTAIPVVQEELKVGKREVQRGGVRVFSRIVETPVNESVNLREEHVSVERRPVDQPVSAANMEAFQEQTIELREAAEEAVVEKSARVVEEVVVGKQVTERQEEIHDTVRHTDVQVEQLGGATAANSADTANAGMTGTTGNTAGDAAWRTHWTSNYGSAGGAYEDYAPAYSYGNQMAGQYKGREWNDVESDLRTDWDTRNGKSGASTWEKFKGAIRQGWGS